MWDERVPIASSPSNAFGVAPLRFAPPGDRAAAIGTLATMAFDGRTRPERPGRAVEGHGEQTPEARQRAFARTPVFRRAMGVKLSDRNRRSRRIACDASLTPSTAPASAAADAIVFHVFEPGQREGCLRVDLAGQVAFVTGAAGAIGGAIARRLADNGAAIVVADVNRAGAEAMAASLPDAIACAVDIRDEAAIDAAVSQTMARYGRLDILINNAGVNTLEHRVNIDAFP